MTPFEAVRSRGFYQGCQPSECAASGEPDAVKCEVGFPGDQVVVVVVVQHAGPVAVTPVSHHTRSYGPRGSWGPSRGARNGDRDVISRHVK